MPIIKNKTLISLTKLFKVSKLDIEFPKNINREYEVISGTGSGAVMIIPVSKKSMFFIMEYAAAIDSYALTFPKGKIDQGEQILDAANRELQEEIGYKSSNLKHIYTIDLAPGYINHQTHIVLAKDLSPSELNGDEPEELEVIEMPLNRIKENLLKYNNIDSRVLASLYIYNNLHS
tara:strand:- start:135 stop:662 length:528 start_codon:yes stop_codon:yes gene_type:complete